MNKEEAFYLPFVTFISLIILSTVTTSIILYQNERQITEQLLHQIEAETILQMTIHKFSSEQMNNDERKGKIKYNFPSGESIVHYEKIEHQKYSCTIEVFTSKDVKIDTFIHVVVN